MIKGPLESQDQLLYLTPPTLSIILTSSSATSQPLQNCQTLQRFLSPLYIARFKHLARDAGYDLAALATADLFALGLRKKIFDACMFRDNQPETFDEWIAAAKAELTKRARRYAMQESVYQSQTYHGK